MNERDIWKVAQIIDMLKMGTDKMIILLYIHVDFDVIFNRSNYFIHNYMSCNIEGESGSEGRNPCSVIMEQYENSPEGRSWKLGSV